MSGLLKKEGIADALPMLEIGMSLLERGMAAIVPEPIVFCRDDEGTPHLLGAPPLRTVIRVDALPYSFWITIDEISCKVTFIIDGKTLEFVRIGVDPHGDWICDRKTPWP
jgi:hypothetical protein